MSKHSTDMDRVALLAARDLMTKAVVTLRPEDGIRDAAAALIENNVHGAPVVDEDGKVLGVLSMTDLTRHEREREHTLQRESDWYQASRDGRQHGVNWSKGWHVEAGETVRVRDVMSPFVISVYENASLWDVVSILLRNQIHRLVVVREPGPVLVGVISETDVLVALYAAMSPEQARPASAK